MSSDMEADNHTPIATITPSNGGQIILAPNSEGPRANKRGRKKSVVWDYFAIRTEGPGCTKAICNQCNRAFAYINGSKLAGTSHLKRHISLGICPASDGKNQVNLFTPAPGTGNSTEPPPKRRLRATPRMVPTPFDQDRCVHEIAKMIIQQDYPLHIVEHSGFIDFVRSLQPNFNTVSFNTIQGECVSLYLREKQNLLNLISSNPGRISLTLDLWTSNQSVAYVFVTGYYIDADWTLHRRLLNVVMVPSPDSEYVFSQAVVACLSDWNLEHKLFTLTLNPSFSKESVIENLRGLLCVRNPLLINGQLIIGDCYARVLSRLALDSLGAAEETVKKIRNCVKYVKTSDAHEETFDEIKGQLQVPSSKELFVDDHTRWDTTYYMLAAACELKEVFGCLETSDPHFKIAPSMEDWKHVEILCTYLKLFIDAAGLISASSYPAASVFYPEVSKIQLELTQASMSPDPFTCNLARPLKETFDKYWSTCCLILAVAVVMDPRYKMKLVEFSFPKIFGDDAGTWVRTIDDSIHELYLEYTMQMLPLPEPFAETHHHDDIPPPENYVEAGNDNLPQHEGDYEPNLPQHEGDYEPSFHSEVAPTETYTEAEGKESMHETETLEPSVHEDVPPTEIHDEAGKESIPETETLEKAIQEVVPSPVNNSVEEDESTHQTETQEASTEVVPPPKISSETGDDSTQKMETLEAPTKEDIPPEICAEAGDDSKPKTETTEDAPPHEDGPPKSGDRNIPKNDTQEAASSLEDVAPKVHIEVEDDSKSENEALEESSSLEDVPPPKLCIEVEDDSKTENDTQEAPSALEPEVYTESGNDESIQTDTQQVSSHEDNSTPKDDETQQVSSHEDNGTPKDDEIQQVIAEEMLPQPEPFIKASSPEAPETYDEAGNDEIMHESPTQVVAEVYAEPESENMVNNDTQELPSEEILPRLEPSTELSTHEEIPQLQNCAEAGEDEIMHEAATQEAPDYDSPPHEPEIHAEPESDEIMDDTETQQEGKDCMQSETQQEAAAYEPSSHNEVPLPETYAEAENGNTSETVTQEALSHEVGPYSEPGNGSTPKTEIQEPAPSHDVLSETFDGPPLEDVHFISVGDGLSDFEVYISEIASQQTKSELDQYLEESVLPRVQDFDVLGWWKMNKQKYPTLSKMAADILSVPISTVAPDSVFKTGVRNIDSYRSTLRPVTLEALICAKDWLQGESDFSYALPKMKF